MKYINNEVFYVLDIESGKAAIGDDIPNLVWLCYGYLTKYDKRGNGLSTFYFREWDKLKKELSFINNNSYKTLIFVHNLAFEGDFLIKNVSTAKNFCSNSNHHFISLELNGFPNIEFRCSYSLSGMSLRELGSIVGLEKLEDEYHSYLPSETIPESSKRYCQRDCDIVALYISKVIREYKQLSNIPYTKTGRVRKMLRDFYKLSEDSGTKWDLYPDEDVYDLITDAFMGGVTTSNPRYTGIELKNVHSYDKKSSYPSVMLIEKYPSEMKKALYNSLSEYKKHQHFIVKIKLFNLKSKYEWGWVSTSKCEIDKDTIEAEIFNGKILEIKDEWITTTLTDVDLQSLMNTYTFEKYEIIDGCVSDEHNKLPPCYIKVLEHYSKAKYEAKEAWNKNPTKENYEAMVKAKADFNSIYGMCVQKICPETFTIDEHGIWEKEDLPYVKQKKHLKRNFLYGVYITAYARKSLLDGIINNCEGTFVYCDTDSIKFIGKNEFIDTTPELIEYRDNESIYGLGKFEYEGTYDEFKTYGAKKYCFTKDGKTEYVVAGLPKGIEIGSIENFRLNTFFPDCKLASIYICDDMENVKLTIDGMGGEDFKVNREKINEFKRKHNIITNGGVALFPVGYLLNMTDSDIDVIKRRYKRKTV
jgi:hypothetical protein